MKIFIGSVFVDNHMEWSLRKRVSQELNCLRHNTWRWEVEGEKEHSTNRRVWTSIVESAVYSSDLVIIFYKTSAGDPTRSEFPFYPTDFELVSAVKFGKPLRLYIINTSIVDENLKDVLALFEDEIIIGNTPRYCQDENDFISKVLTDVIKLKEGSSIIKIITPFSNIIFPKETLEDFIECILPYDINSGNYKEAYSSLLKVNLEKFVPIQKQEKVLMARYLGMCANIYSNQALYPKAIIAARKSIRLFMEAGEWVCLFSQIQALSGILNAAGIKSALNINSYGNMSIRLSKYSHLEPMFLDSRASILRDAGQFKDALKLIKYDWEESPYTGAKYAHLLGFSSSSKIDEARVIIEGNILKLARTQNKDVAYVLKEAAILAVRNKDNGSALKFIYEA